MAKISANGATEVARIKTLVGNSSRYLWVMTSDGRILRRSAGEYGSGYTVYRRKVHPDNRNRDHLAWVATTVGHRVVSS